MNPNVRCPSQRAQQELFLPARRSCHVLSPRAASSCRLPPPLQLAPTAGPLPQSSDSAEALDRCETTPTPSGQSLGGGGASRRGALERFPGLGLGSLFFIKQALMPGFSIVPFSSNYSISKNVRWVYRRGPVWTHIRATSYMLHPVGVSLRPRSHCSRISHPRASHTHFFDIAERR